MACQSKFAEPEGPDKQRLVPPSRYTQERKIGDCDSLKSYPDGLFVIWDQARNLVKHYVYKRLNADNPFQE